MAKRDPLPPRGPDPIPKYRLTVTDRRFLRSLRIAQDDETTARGDEGQAAEE